MRKSRRPIVIASRRSRLAKAQAQAVGRALGKLHTHIEVRYVWLESEGDQLANVPLHDKGGKGLFTRAVERALLDQKADIAVHSLKDLPADNTPGLSLAAVPKRGDVRDCLVSLTAETLDDLPPDAVVGTASPRRAAQLLKLRPDLRTELIRGNVETRLKRVLDEQAFDATIMAVAGLKRAGLSQHARNPIPIETMLPAACQGALALQCRVDDHVTLTRCLPLNNPAAAAAVHIERQLLACLGASCHSAVAILARPLGDDVRTFAVDVEVLSPDGRESIAINRQATGKELDKLPARMLEDLYQQGARRLLNLPPVPRRPPVPEPTATGRVIE